MPSQAVARLERYRARIALGLAFDLVPFPTVDVQGALLREHYLALVALVGGLRLLRLVVGRHVAEKVAVLCEFHPAVLTGVDQFPVVCRPFGRLL